MALKNRNFLLAFIGVVLMIIGLFYPGWIPYGLSLGFYIAGGALLIIYFLLQCVGPVTSTRRSLSILFAILAACVTAFLIWYDVYTHGRLLLEGSGLA